MTTGLSRSGARIRGDQYQHLFTWVRAVEAVWKGDTAKIGVEDPKAGNADDVTVYRDNGERECYQVKSAVDGRNTVNVEWLTDASRSGGPSILRGFYRLWAGGPDDQRPKITLVTNRLPSPTDPLLVARDGLDYTVARRLESAKPRSKVGRIRKRLAGHLEVTEEEAVAFFRDLRFMLGVSYGCCKDMARCYMLVAGLRQDDAAIDRGVDIVRGWVTSGKREITIDELRREVDPLKLQDGPSASLLVQAIDRDPAPGAATVSLDWSGLFSGSEPRTRHLPSDSELWNGKFRAELNRAARTFRAQGDAHVLVRGYMRLPTWFAAGAELGKTAGFQISWPHGYAVWSSEGRLASVAVENTVETLGVGRDLAAGIALSSDLSPDVREYLAGQHGSVGKYVGIYPTGGASNQSVGGAAEARGYAYAIRDLVRGLVREHRPDQLHLFLATPSGVALLLGHLWDHMPSTQLYESLGAARGYAPCYLIPG